MKRTLSFVDHGFLNKEYPTTFLQETYEYNERFRLGFHQFAYLLERLEAVLEHPTQRNKALSPHQQLQIALHW